MITWPVSHRSLPVAVGLPGADRVSSKQAEINRPDLNPAAIRSVRTSVIPRWAKYQNNYNALLG
jgi:hypothetical protein